MENLFFCLNATLPIFFTMLLGYGFRKIGLLDESFIKKINRFLSMTTDSATFDASLRFLKEDPWERLRKFRDGFKNTKLQTSR